jgi:hypothetical protein
MSASTSGSNGRACGGDARILYCNCTYAKIIPPEVKGRVLKGLSSSGVAFDAVADLCEMSARRDPALKRLAETGNVKIAACYPRAVRWLFHAADAALPKDGVEILNMREQDAGEVVSRLLAPEVREPAGTVDEEAGLDAVRTASEAGS